MKKFIFYFFCYFLCCATLNAQYKQFTLQDKVEQSELILEGKVIGQYTYKKDGLIYTANHLEVCDIIYDRNLRESITEIFAITYGGQLDGEFTSWTHLLNLHENKEGIFFLRSNIAIIPDNPPADSIYYEVYGQEQGFIAYSKDDSWDFAGNGLFTGIVDADEYISQINSISEQTSVTESCILDQKSGIVLKIDTIFFEQEDIVIQTAIKGQWSKNYDLEKAKIQIQFSSATDLSSYNFSVTPLNSSLQTNYVTSWTQPDNQSAELEVLKNVSTFEYQGINNQFSGFLKISFHASLLSVGIASVELAESSYKEGSQIINFIEYEVENNKFLKEYFATPEITSFSPSVVCAGVKADQSSGNPIVDGHVIIQGNNFDDLNPVDFPTLMPNQYRVEFNREETLGSNSFKVTPLPEDYVYWTNTEIKVRVPTAGWLVNNNNIISNQEVAVATTGRITVRNPDGSDHTGDDDLVIRFANFNALDPATTNHSFSRKLIDQSSNGGYYFVFDSSFDNIYPSNTTAAKQDVIDAICEWNMITSAKLEVVTVCPPSATCFKITYENFNSSGGGTIALAAGVSQPSPFSCPNEAVILFMELRYNNEISDWKPSSEADPLIDDHIIKTSAYHEIAHLLQLGHVYNDDALMHPLYDSGGVIDTDASAGGTHVSNVSAATACPNPLIQGIITSCMTPTVEIQEGNFVTLSPNPTNDWLHLNFEKDWNKYEIEIYDVLGQLKTREMITSSNHQIDVSDFPSGTYLLILKDGSFSKSIKFTKL